MTKQNEEVQELINFRALDKSYVQDDEIDKAKIMYKELQDKINPFLETQDQLGIDETLKDLYENIRFDDGIDITNDLSDILAGHQMILTYEKDDIILEITVEEVDTVLMINPNGTVIANGNMLTNISLDESKKK